MESVRQALAGVQPRVSVRQCHRTSILLFLPGARPDRNRSVFAAPKTPGRLHGGAVPVSYSTTRTCLQREEGAATLLLG
jgi:hypothetical protein